MTRWSKIIDSSKLIQRFPDVPGPLRRRWNEFSAAKNDPTKVEAWLNPSLAVLDGKLWMSYRIEIRPWMWFGRTAVVQLNESFEPLPDTNRVLELPTTFDNWCAVDARFVVGPDNHFMAYTDGLRQYLATLDGDLNPVFSCAQQSPRKAAVEKNWAFFVPEWNKILAVYVSEPEHSVLELADIGLELKWSTPWKSGWNHGEIRGGASPVLHEGLYHHFFHSSVEIKPSLRRYYVGLLKFSSVEPYEPIFISTAPVLEGRPDPGTKKLAPWPHEDCFICGALRWQEGWLLSHGVNGHSCAIDFVPDSTISLRPAR